MSFLFKKGDKVDGEALKKKGLAAAEAAKDQFEQLKAEGFLKHFQE